MSAVKSGRFLAAIAPDLAATFVTEDESVNTRPCVDSTLLPPDSVACALRSPHRS